MKKIVVTKLVFLFATVILFSQTAIEYAESGRKNIDNENWQAAIDDFTKAIKLTFDDEGDDAQMNIGGMWLNMIYPNNACYYYLRGYAKVEMDDYQGSIADFSYSIKLANTNFYPIYYRGVAKSNLQDYRGAISDFDKAIKLEPYHPQTYLERGRAKALLGDYKKSIPDFNKAIEKKTDFGVAYLIRGISKYKSGDRKGACMDWSKAGELGEADAYDKIQKYCK